MNQTRPNEDTTITNIKRIICSININFPRSNFKKMSIPTKNNKSNSKSHTLNQALNCIIKNSIQLFNFSYNYHPLFLQKLVLALWSRAGKAAFTLPSPDPSCRAQLTKHSIKSSNHEHTKIPITLQKKSSAEHYTSKRTHLER